MRTAALGWCVRGSGGRGGEIGEDAGEELLGEDFRYPPEEGGVGEGYCEG